MSENENLIGGLIRKRAEIAGRIEATQMQLRQLVIDIDNVDATIRLFQPDIDLEEIRPKPLPPRHTAFKGEVQRIVLGMLRDTGMALTTKDITLRVMSERNLNLNDKKLVRIVSKRVGACLKHHRNKGLVKSERRGGGMLWEIVR
jgi:hypothetical protein